MRDDVLDQVRRSLGHAPRAGASAARQRCR